MYFQDMDRIIFSEPFRRLANKTQVHPLYENDHIHQRLIHSMEVWSVGRSLGTEVAQHLSNEKLIDDEQKIKIPGVVQAACLAHDIGNPPFGHSGEEAIGNWFQEKIAEGRGIFSELDRRYHQEFSRFEGNAQGFRILSRNEMYVNDGGMRLSLAVLGAFVKYPATANVSSACDVAYCGLKKYGIFEDDFELFREVAAGLALPGEYYAGSIWWRRHPLVFLVEAADDICYNIMDLEDAYLAGELDEAVVLEHLQMLNNSPPSGRAYSSPAARVSASRAFAVRGAIDVCVQAFINNYDKIMSGEFSIPLVDASDKSKEFNNIKEIARRRIFKSRRKVELEVVGRNALYKILDSYLPIVESLSKNKWNADDIIPYHKNLAGSTGFNLNNIVDVGTSLHSLTDFISGMTDRYAIKVANMLYAR